MKNNYQVILNGKVWSNYLTESQAAKEAIYCRNKGLGMAYVEKMVFAGVVSANLRLSERP